MTEFLVKHFVKDYEKTEKVSCAVLAMEFWRVW